MRRRRLATVALCAALTAIAVRGVAARSLTEPARLAAIYDLILDARFEEAASATREACGPAPPLACQLLDVTALWWRIQLDERSTALDDAFAAQVDAAIEAAEAWTEREPDRAEAWFYLGGAYGARVQWRVLREQRLAAARDGKRIREALERALELDPGLHDARFGIGLYKYYADIAPAAAKVLRFLLLLPGGDKAEGLRDMLAARQHGALLRGEADYQLHWIYFWYEEDPERGLAVLRDLQTHHPANPLFPQRIAEVQVEYFHDPSASLATWQSMIRDAEAGRLSEPPLALARARLGAAAQLDVLHETDRAAALAARVAHDRPEAPHGATARAQLLLGTFEDRLDRRARAEAAYRAAIAAAPSGDATEIAARARAGLRRAPDARAAQGYRLSLEGWRAFERGALAEAEGSLDRALALRPADPVAAYRRGRVHRARGEDERALERFTRVTAAQPAAPPVFLARALVDRAELLELAGDRAGALESYRRAARVFGADARTRRLAGDAVARLRMLRAPASLRR